MSNDLNIINYLESGIKAEAAKQNTIASNVANLNTPGYRRVDVKFQELLNEAIEAGEPFDHKNTELEIVSPHDSPVNANGNDVNLDREVSDMVKNNLMHTTFVRLLRKKYDLMEEAIRGV